MDWDIVFRFHPFVSGCRQTQQGEARGQTQAGKDGKMKSENRVEALDDDQVQRL